MIEIVKCKSEDLVVVQKIAFETWPICYQNIISQEQINYMLDLMYSLDSLRNQLTEKKHVFILAKEEESYVGFASFEINAELNNTKLHKLYVLPEIQGKNIGKQLIKFVEDSALEKGQEAVFLNVNKNNPAIKFYERMNYKVSNQIVINIGNGYVMDDYIMEKKLV